MMKHIFTVFFLLTVSYCLFNMTTFSNMPSKVYSNGLGFSAMQNNAKEIYLSVKTTPSAASIVRWNATSSLNVTQMGTYKQSGSQSNVYYYTYFLNGYILGCLGYDNTPCRVFNQSSYAYLGTLSINLSFGRGEYLPSKNIFVFGATTGQFGYFTVTNLPNVTPVYVYNLSSVDFVFLQKSHDDTFISVSYRSNAIVNIWRVSDWALLKNITVGSAGVYTQAWSNSNRYLMVFIFNQSYVEVYDQESNWTLVRNVSIGYKNIRTNFYYNETNVVVAFSENSTSVITINWYDYSVMPIYSINGWKMYRSDNGEALTIFQPNNGVNTAWFFNINPYCQGNTVFNIPQKKCVGKCQVGCLVCLLSSCTLCQSGYELVNGACQSCGPVTAYNALTLSCDNCQSNCNECTSSSICTKCKSGYNLVNSSCKICPVGTVYNSTSLACEGNCTANCLSCGSSTTCSICKSNYVLQLNGSCQSCPSGTYYNSSNLSCNSCSTNCDECSSSTSCSVCSSGSYLVNNSCITCPTGLFYNYTSSTCQANCVSNCESCSNTTNCAICKSGYQLVNNSCVGCPSGTYYNSSNLSCNSCSINCVSCSSSSQCTVCQNGYHLNNSQCVSCPVGNIFNTTTMNCQVNCTQNCIECQTATTCKQCVSNYDLFHNGTCLQCPSGYIFDLNTKDCVINTTTNNTNNTSTTNSTNNTNIDPSTNSTTNTNTTNNPTNNTNSNTTNNTTNTTNSTDSNTTNNTNNNTTNGNNNTNNTNNSNNNTNGNINNQTTIIDNNNTPINNTTNQTIIIIPPNNDNNTLSQQQLARSKYNTLYEWTMGMTVQNNFVAILNTFPGSRRIIRQIFAFFLNIDHLWLYIYHKRQYGYYVNRLLKAVQNLQQEKWNLVSNQVFNQTFKIDVNYYAQQINFKINQTSYKYIQIQGQSSSFFENNLDYFFLNVPLVLGTFFFFKFLFHLLFRYQISLLFREYAFNGYLLLMLVQGNCESFSYLFMYDSMELNDRNFKQKIFNILTILFFMFFIMQLIAGFFIIKSYYDKYSKYFYDNCSNTLTGSVCLLIQYGLLNFCLGAAHIVLENYYNTQLLVLFFIEASFITVIIYSLKKLNVYEFKYIEWMNVLASFLRILLIFTYYCDQKMPGFYEVIDQVQMYLIIIYLFNWIFSALIAYFIVLYNLYKYIQKKLFPTISEKESIIKSQESRSYLTKYKNLNNKSPKKLNIIIQALNEVSKVNKFENKKATKLNIQFIDKNGENNKDSDQDQEQDQDFTVSKLKINQFKFKSNVNFYSTTFQTSNNHFSKEKSFKEQQQNDQDEIIKDKRFGGKSHKKLILKFKRDRQEQNIQQWKDNQFQVKTQLPQKNNKRLSQQQQVDIFQKIDFPQQPKNQRFQTRRRSSTQAQKQVPLQQRLPLATLDQGRKTYLKSIRLKTNKKKLQNIKSL